MDYDVILEHLGEWGLWSWVHQLLLWCGPFISGFTALVYSFTGLEPDKFRCLIPECDNGNPDPEFGDVSSSVYPLDDDDEEDYCKYYPPVNNSAESCLSPSAFNLGGSPLECETKQGNFVYDDFEMDNTWVTEWDLVCDDQYKVALVSSIYMCGILAGSFCFGYLGDMIGRKWALLIAILLVVFAGFGGAFVDDYVWYCVTRFFTGMGSQGCMVLSFVLAVELTGAKTRTIVGINIQTAFAIGESVCSVIGIRVKEWRDFQMWTSMPLLICLPMFLVLPESPRWLLKTNKTDSFIKVVKQGARWNKVDLPSELLETDVNANEKVEEAADNKESGDKLGISSLFASKAMITITLVMWINWIVVTLGYYGISLGIGDIGPDLFIDFLLISLIEIPSYIFATLTVDHLGRKTLYIFSMLLTGVGCLAAAFLEDGTGVKTALSMTGKFGASAAFAIIYLYTGELHPTEIRSTAVGLCSTMARIGGIAAPQIALYFPTFTFDAFPMLFMGIASLIGGALALLLPETLGEPLVEKIEDVDELGKNGKPFFSWWSSAKVKQHLEEQLEAKESDKAENKRA